MNDTFKPLAAIPVILLVLVEAVSGLLFGVTTALVVEGAFSVAVLAIVFAASILLGKTGGVVFGFSGTAISVALLITQLVLNVIGAALGNASMPLVPLLSLALLAIDGIALISSSVAARHAKNVEDATSRMGDEARTKR